MSIASIADTMRPYIPTRCLEANPDIEVYVQEAIYWVEEKLGCELQEAFGDRDDHTRRGLFWIVALLAVSAIDPDENHQDARFAAAMHMLEPFIPRAELAE